ncbi:galactose oxidase [Flavobacteriales bacterium 33_180_T64]|nr:galactose oxidase [Flavobacteriales bacterium 33_180_T64]
MKIRLKTKLIFKMVCIAFLILSCSSEDDDTQIGDWQERSVFDGIPRSNAVGFVINAKGYMGTGYDGDDYLNDFWEYNIEGDYWVQKADFIGVERSSASGFAIDGNGYIGVGYDGDNELGDFYQYNVSTNTWEQKADFGGGFRRSAVSFSANSSGYIGTGYDGENDKKDFWKYSPLTNQWSELIGFGGDKRRDATTFVIDDKVYLGTGVSNGLYKDDFWEFDTGSETWTRLEDLDNEDDLLRSNAVGFSINGLGYIATGYNFSSMSSIWEYNPSNDSWDETTAFEATFRQDAITFNDQDRAFVLLGRTGSLYFDDNYEFLPTVEYDEDN